MKNEDNMIVNMKFVTIPNEPDMNGRIYSEEVYNKMMNDPFVVNMINHNALFVSENPLGPDKMYIDLLSTVGRIVEMYDNNTADVIVTNPYWKHFFSLCNGHLEHCRIGMEYFIKKETKKDDITYIEDMKFKNFYLDTK